MTSTITARPCHARPDVDRWGPASELYRSGPCANSGRYADAEITAPIPVPLSSPVAYRERRGFEADARREARPGRAMLVGLVAVAVVLLAGTAGGAYLLGVTRSAATAPLAPAPLPTAPSPSAAPGTAAPSGPQLLEADGNPVDSAVAEQIRNVYTALGADDVASIRVAYGATGSDDGLLSESHLSSAAVRAGLLAALRTHPVHDTHGYTYRSAGYGAVFNQALGPLGAGLGRLLGPWDTTPAPTSSSSTASSTATKTTATTKTPSRASSSCTAGTHPGGDSFYPCTDNATGAAVGYDGTFGVHGLKPCPPGTELTDGVGHNPKTGAVCAMP